MNASNRRTVWSLAALLTFAVGERASAQEAVPPADTVDHEVTHTVKPGDTLWGIAGTYLNDPFRWPDIFRRNPDVVENPHLIYPGEVIRIPAGAVRAEALAAAARDGAVVATIRTVPVRPSTVFAPGGAAGQRRLEIQARDRSTGVRPGEVDVAPFIVGEDGPVLAGKIVGSAERPGIAMNLRDRRFQLNDVVYVTLPPGAGPAVVGTRFTSLELGPVVMDSARLAIPTAILRIEEASPGRPIAARVVRQFGTVMIGQQILTYTPASLESGRAPLASLDAVEGRIVWVHNDPVLPSLQHYVLLDVAPGTARVGDRFMLIDQTRRGAADSTRPPEPAALAQVVRVTPYAATAIVVDQELPTISVGMRARLTARVP